MEQSVDKADCIAINLGQEPARTLYFRRGNGAAPWMLKPMGVGVDIRSVGER